MNTTFCKPHTDDNESLELIRNNNDVAFSMLYKKYQQSLLMFASRYLPDSYSCDEVVQDLFVQLHLRRFSLKIDSSFSSYLFAAIRNKIFNYLRDKAVYKKHIIIAANRTPVAQNNIEQFMDMKQLEDEISISLNQMPVKCKEVYVLHHQNNVPLKHISELLSRPVDTIEKQFRKATAILRNHLTDNIIKI